MYQFPPRCNRDRLEVPLFLIKRDPLSTSLTAFGTWHSRSSSCLKTIVISWLWGSATAQGWDPSIHTSSHGLYMSIAHSLFKMHCLTHLVWPSPDMWPRKVNESPQQWKPFRGAWVYFRISAMKQTKSLVTFRIENSYKCSNDYIHKSCLRFIRSNSSAN